MKRAGIWKGAINNSKKSVVIDQLDSLSDVELELTLDFVLMLKQRERRSRKKD